jgi:hypothetical protein
MLDQALVTQAYLYGYPLVADLTEVVRFTQGGMGSLVAAPFNEFSHANAMAGPADTFVSINNDTLYSIAQLDLSGGPLVLQVPDAGDRYYVLQFVDAWSNNFAYVGTRGTGNRAGTFFVTGPGWEGDVPADAAQIAAPTNIATIVGRSACAGVDDIPAVAAFQAGLELRAAPGNGSLAGVPTPPSDAFFDAYFAWSAAFPPAPADVEYQQQFAVLADADPTELAPAISKAKAALETFLRAGGNEVNGWQLNPHVFDYNLDFFGPGTIDSPEWKIADRQKAYATRAAAARGGLWGNHGYEAVYAGSYHDADGNQLNGANSYTLRFTTTPPVDAFWSITMYDMPDYYLVANPIDRYSIGDRTPGLITDADGSLTIVMQRDEPANANERANWLPTPPGDFRPLMRMYMPNAQVLDGSYVLPPITLR